MEKKEKNDAFRIDRKVIDDMALYAENRAGEYLDLQKDELERFFTEAQGDALDNVLDIIAHGREENKTEEDILFDVIDYCVSATKEYHFDDWLALGEAVEVEDGSLADLADGFSSVATLVEPAEGGDA